MDKPASAATIRALIGAQHWPLKTVLLALWALASFGACYFARDLQFLVAGWPFGFWMAAQGAVLVFLAIVVLHAWAMNRAEQAAPPLQPLPGPHSAPSGVAPDA